MATLSHHLNILVNSSKTSHEILCFGIFFHVWSCHKKVKANPRLLFEKLWYNRSTRCLISSFKAIGPLVPEKQSFRGFYCLLAWPTCWSCDLDHLNTFCSLSPKTVHIKLSHDFPSGSWRGIWNCHTMRVLGQNNDLCLLYSHTFMYSWRQLIMPV